METRGLDNSLDQADLRENLLQQMASLKYSVETLQQELEQQGEQQMDKNQELEQEVGKLEAALNTSFSRWGELRAGHTEVVNQTLAILASLARIRVAHSTTENPGTVDGVTALQDGTTPSSSSSVPECSRPKRLRPKDVTCVASSTYGPDWACAKVTRSVRRVLVTVMNFRHLTGS